MSTVAMVDVPDQHLTYVGVVAALERGRLNSDQATAIAAILRVVRVASDLLNAPLDFPRSGHIDESTARAFHSLGVITAVSDTFRRELSGSRAAGRVRAAAARAAELQPVAAEQRQADHAVSERSLAAR